MIPKRKRIKDKQSIRDVRQEHCEICGSTGTDVHHVITRGSGGPDHKLNLICTCRQCHAEAHSGEIPRRFLFGLIAKREGMTVEEVEEMVRGMKA